MNYIEYMTNLRYAMRVISEKIPEVIRVAETKAMLEKDQDIDILLMSDADFYHAQERYLEIEPTLFQFNPDEEYGAVRTMNSCDMKGES